MVAPLTHDRREHIAEAVKGKAYEIINAKGATSFGIAAVVSILCDTILFDQHQIRPVSSWQASHGCCMSMPAVIGRQGILSEIAVPLDGEEREALEVSAQKIRECIESIYSIQSMEGSIPSC
jgi:L-lactate dehydrogenase